MWPPEAALRSMIHAAIDRTHDKVHGPAVARDVTRDNVNVSGSHHHQKSSRYLWSVRPPEAMLMSVGMGYQCNTIWVFMAHVALRLCCYPSLGCCLPGYDDICNLCWRAVLMSVVCTATSDHAEVHGTCYHHGMAMVCAVSRNHVEVHYPYSC